MRIFIAVLVLIFSLQSWTRADDISEFEIEGMSIGDSALDFFSEEDIKRNIRDSYKDKTFTLVLNDNYPFFKTYDSVDFHFKTGDKKYIFHNIDGVLTYENNIEDCYEKMDSITNDIEENLNYLKKNSKKEFTHRGDKTGKSKFTQVRFVLKNGYISIMCYDYSDDYGSQDHLAVTIDSEEVYQWLLSDIY
tara:strand:- start:85 stop:657 length:573 start_codon:yes stop_codon:yes gene_type:complete